MAKARKRSSPLITALEPRMLLDGAALTEATQAINDTELQQSTPEPEPEPAPEQPPETSSSNTDSAPLFTQDGAEPVFAMSDDPSGQVIVVDASVPFADELLAGIPPEWTVIRLEAGSDGLTQLAQALQGMSNLGAIHVFSHGGEGRVELGATSLTNQNLQDHADTLRQIGQHLSSTGDLMMYGCDVAQGFMGQEFVDALARMTGADVAASDDSTGNVFVGGDWQLEYQSGDIATASLAGSEQYNNVLADYSINIGKGANRLMWQASGLGGGVYWQNTDRNAWVDEYTTNRSVPYWGTEWRSVSYPVPRWGWLPWEMRTSWYQIPVERRAEYGTGTRYGTTTFTLTHDSAYQLDVKALAQYKEDIPGGNGSLSLGTSDVVGLNVALYNGTFNPAQPLHNLVAASQGEASWFGYRWGAGNLYRDELKAGTYTVVVSFDGWRFFSDNNIWWSRGNNYAEQVWGNYNLTVTNLNRAPVWTARDLDMLMDGSGSHVARIPWSLAGNATVTDPDGDNITVDAHVWNGTTTSALPSWLKFNANDLSFTGNPPANTAPITIRLTADDGQATSTRDFVLRFANDNDRPVLAVPVQDLVWDGSGPFSWSVPAGTFTDADPGAGNFTYSATLSDGNPLPNWLSMGSSGTLSGNPPANFASLQIRITANDGTGQATATQTDELLLNLVNNNDIPTVTSISKAINEDSTYSFSAADFVFADTDTRASDDTTTGIGKSLQQVRIVSLPANGTLWLDADNDGVLDHGEALQVNQTVTAANLGKLRYTPNPNWAGAVGLDRSSTPDSFQWTASDGVNEAAAPATTTITVNLINDAPVLAFSEGRTLSIRPNTGNTLAAVTVDAGLVLSDVDAPYTSNTSYDEISEVKVSIAEKVSGNFITGDLLEVTTVTGISANYNSSTGVLTLSGNASAAQYQQVLRSLTFSSSNNSNDNVRQISIQLRATDVGTLTYADTDGVDDFMDTMEGTLPTGGDFTLSVWAQIDSTVANGQYTILAQGNSPDNFFIQLNKVNSNWQMRLGNLWTLDNTFPSDGKWHQYTVTRSGTSGTLYIDGIKVASTNGSTSLMEATLPGTSLRIGTLYRENDLQEWLGGFWNGGISDVRVYNRIISPDEMARSLNRDVGLTGYEANLVAWYPLQSDLNNQATGFNWSLGRDFNPLNGDGTDGPWSVGVITGNASNSGLFNWGAFQAYTQANAAWTMQTDPRGSASDYIQLDHKDAWVGNTTSGWARFMFPNGFDNVSSFTFSPGTVGILPGYVNPAAMQFTAPAAGVYTVDARFWDAHPATAAQLTGWTSPSYKVFKVNAAGTSGVEISPGPVQTGDGTTPTSASARSALQQVVLAAGERLVFAVHKGDGAGVNGDEIQAAIDVSLIATAVQSGGNTWYYNHATGRYIGLSSSAATWANAQTAAGSFSLAGKNGYLATATDTTSLNIFRALMREAGQASVFAGGYQLANATDNSSTGYRDGWFWSSGPKAGQLFDGPWGPGEPNSSTQDVLAIHAPLGSSGRDYHLAAYDDGTATDSYRYLIEIGDTALPAPAELAAALSSFTDPGNTLVFVDRTTVYSAATGHYYKLATSSADFATQQQAASSTQVQSNSGYLAQATTPDELALITRLARLNNSSGVWVGLQNVDTGGGAMDWKWVNANGTVAGNLDSSTIYQTAESTNALETAGWTRVAYDGFDKGRTGWRFPQTGNPVPLWYDQLMAVNGDSADPSFQIQKAFDINNKETVLTFRFNRYDSWDNEIFAISVQGTGSNYALFQETLASSLVTTPVSKTVNGVKYTFTPLPNYGNFFGAGFNDQSFEVQIELPANFGDTLTVSMDTNLDQRGNDETYGVDNFTLWQKNVPANPGLGGTFEDFEGGVRTGWDNANGETAGYNSTVTVNRGDGSPTALWFNAWQPQKTYYIGNEATRVEFDFYALDSWDTGERFYAYINDGEVINFLRSTGVNYTDVVTGSAVINGKPVTWSLSPNSDYGNWTTSTGATNTGWNDQSFHIVIDLPENFGESFELKFATNLDSGGTDESAAIDNVRVYSRENAGWVDPYTGVLQSDASALPESTSNFVFNGQQGDYLDLGRISGGDSGLSGDYTLEAWIYAESASPWARIFDLGNGAASNNILLAFDNNTGKITLHNYTGSTSSTLTTTGILPLNRWVHIAAVNNGDGTGAIHIYDDVAKTTATTTGNITPGVDVTRTSNFAGRSNWDNPNFRGQMNQLRIWNYARSLTDIQNNRGGIQAAVTSDNGLLGYWERSQLDASGRINDLSNKDRDAWQVRIEDIVRLDQFASINLTNNRNYTDGDWNIWSLATDGRFMYAYTVNNDGGTYQNSIQVFNMQGQLQTNLWPDASMGISEMQMAYSSGWLYIRNSQATSTASDDIIYRVSTTDGKTTPVSVDSSKSLLDGQAWARGSLFNMPDGRLGIVSTVDASGNAKVRLYTLADNGTRMVWDRDYDINIGAGWWGDSHGATSDGRYLYLLRHVGGGDDDYKVVDLFTGKVALDGSNYNLYQQSVHNPTNLTIDPLTGDVYFADFEGSHLGRASRTNGATREAVVEYGANGATLTAPLLTTQANVAKPDVFVTDTRDIQVRVGNTAPSVSSWTVTATEDQRLNFAATDFTSRFSDPEIDTLATLTLTSVPDASHGVLQLNGSPLANGAVLAAGDLDKLVFVPASNYNGSTSFSYTASDGDLSSSGNSDTSKRTATVTINVTAVNDAPVLNTATATAPALTSVAEDDSSNTGTSVADLVVNGSISDVDGSAPEAIAVISVNNTYGVWQFQIGNGNWTAFSGITGKNVDLGSAARLLGPADKLRFVPAPHFNGTASLGFKAWDQSSGSVGETTDPNALGGNNALSSATATASISVTAVNDAPLGSSLTVQMLEDSAYSFAPADFGFSDTNDGTAHTLAAVIIETLPVLGTLSLNGTPVTTGQAVTAANISAGLLRYTPLANDFGTGVNRSFTFRVRDSGGTTDGGADTSASAYTLILNIEDTNDAPTAVGWVKNSSSQDINTVAEDAAAGTVVGKLTGTDPNGGDTLRFTRLSNNNFNVAPDGTVTVSSMASLDFERAPTQTLRVRVTDSGGLSYDADVMVQLTDVVESAPSLVTKPFYIAKNDSFTITETQLKASDAQQGPAGLTYTVRESVTGGVFWIDANTNSTFDAGEELSVYNAQSNPNARDTFTHDDVQKGLLRFNKDGTQTSGRLALTLSDGTESVSGTLMAITSNPPVLSPIDNQIWSTTGAQTFQLPSTTFTDPDHDVLSLTATLPDGSALPSWLGFDPVTWTFSGTPPAGTADGSTLTIKVTAKDGRTTPISDEFVITFNATVTSPAITNPIADQTFTGAGSHSYVVPANTFTARATGDLTYTATLANGTLLPDWLGFDASTRTFSGNPPADAAPGPYAIKVTASNGGGSTSTTFRLYVFSANDLPAGKTTLPDRNITDANTYTYEVAASTYFQDGDSDLMHLSAGLSNGEPLPSWVRFFYNESTRQGSFEVKAPGGAGVATVRVYARDPYGGEGYQDFKITYSGGRNEAPVVQTSGGIYTMDVSNQDGTGELHVNTLQKLEKFSVAQGDTGTISKDFLRELDPDDDGTGLTFTVTRGTQRGVLWLDADDSGTLNGAEATLGAGSTFTQADIDSGRLQYRSTDTTTAQGSDPPNDSFVFNLKDGGEDGAQEVKGVSFDIDVRAKPLNPALSSITRANPGTQVTGANELIFTVRFSENVRGVDASDFVVTGSGGVVSTATVQSVTLVDGATYSVKVAGGDLAGFNGTVGLTLKAPTSGLGIARSTSSTATLDGTASATATLESYTLSNANPTVTLAGPALHQGNAFYATLSFSESVNDLTLGDISATNATLSNLQRISTSGGFDPDNPPASYDPNNPPTPTGNLYRVLVTPTAQADVVIGLAADKVYNDSGNPNTAAASITVVRNSLPVVTLDAATPTANRSGTFSEVDGADSTANKVAFSTAGISLADVNAAAPFSQKLAHLSVSVPTTDIVDGAQERLLVDGATAGGHYALNVVDGAALTNVSLSIGGASTEFTVQAIVSGSNRTLRFAKADGTAMTLAEAEALLDALHYNHSGDSPTTTNTRVFSVSVNDGMEDSTAATFTVTVAASNDSPLITAGISDSASAGLTETHTTLRASGTLSVQDLDLAQTVSISKVSVIASGTGPSANAPNNADLLAMLTIHDGASTPGSTVIGSTATTGTAYWTFNSGSTSFDYLAAGETLVLTYTVRATDSHGTPATDDQTITVTITGSNDGPIVYTSAVTALSASSSPMTATGTVTVSDPDANDSLTGTQGTPIITATMGGGGNITLAASSITAIQNALTLTDATPNANPGGVDWSFSLDPALLRSAFSSSDVISVDSFTVMEGGYAVWRVTHAGSTTLSLALTGTATPSTDFGSLEYSLNNSTWSSYTQNIAVTGSGTVYARVAVVAENPVAPDVGETIVLTATSTSGSRVSGTATISEANAGSLSVNSFDVNEGSHAVWTIRAAAAATVTLALSGNATAVSDYGSLEVSVDGTTWTAGTSALVPASGIIYARVAVISETSPLQDAGETITLTASDGNESVEGTATVREGTQSLKTGSRLAINYPLSVTDTGNLSATKLVRFAVVMTSETSGLLVVPGDAGSITEGTPSTLRDSDSLSFSGLTAQSSVSVVTKSISDPASGTLTPDQVNALTNAFSAAISGPAVTWTYSIAESTLDFLSQGDIVTAVFTVTAEGSSQDVTIVINGTNDAPVITSSTSAANGAVVTAGTGTGTASASGTLSASDVDKGANRSWSIAAGGPTSYGSIGIDAATGVWTYTLDNTLSATQALKAGETVTQSYTAVVTDNASATATQTIRVSVTGANDAPTLAAPGTAGVIGSYTDTSASDLHTAVISGTLSGADADAGETLVYAISSQTPDTSESGFTHSKAGNFGKLYLNALTGAYRYVPDDARIEAATAAATDAFTVTVTDAAGTSASQSLSVNITGVNDTLTLNAADVSASLFESNAGLRAQGGLQVRDLDKAQTVTASVTSVSATGSPTGLSADNAALLAMLQVDTVRTPQIWGTSTTVLGSTQTENDLLWLFDSGSQAFNDLREGDTLTLTYVVRVTDGVLPVDQNITVTITGTNDAPRLTVQTGDADSASLNEANASLTASDTLTLADLELADSTQVTVSGVSVRSTSTAPAAAIPANSVLLAMLTTSPTSALTDTSTASEAITWTFNSGANHFNGLANGQTLVLDYSIRATDNASSPLSATKTVTVTITGTNDGVVATAGEVSGQISSGLADQLFDAGHITFSDLDTSDKPTATAVMQSVSGQLRGGGMGSLVLSSAQQNIVRDGFSITPVATNTNNGRIDWNYALRQSDIDFLGSGQSITAVFRITVSDGQGSTSHQDVTITIAGKNNRPFFSLETGDSAAASLTEGSAGLTASDTITVTDTNLTDTVRAIVESTGSNTVQLNTDQARAMTETELSWLQLGAGSGPWTVLNSTQTSQAITWTFDSGTEAFNDLAVGDTLVLRYQIQLTDDADVPASNATAQYITLTITGTNDGPVVSTAAADLAGTVVESGHDTAGTVTPGTPTATGTLSISDADRVKTTQWAIQGTPSSTYGTFGVNAATGAWTYTLDNSKTATQRLALGDTVSQTYTVRATDDQGAHVDQTVTVTIQGANDQPSFVTLRSLLDPQVREDGTTGSGLALPGVPTVSGVARAADVDTGTILTWSLQGTPTVTGGTHRLSSAYGALDLNTTTGTWTYTLDNQAAATQALAEGDSVMDSFTVRVQDQHGAFKDQLVSVEVQGANDVPVFTNAPSAAQADLVEAGINAAGTAVSGTASATGTLVANDLDATDTLTWSVQGTPSTTYGTFSLSGTGVWTYTLDNTLAATQALTAGQLVSQIYEVRVTDSQGGYATQFVVVRITGTNDAPTLSVTAAAALTEDTDASSQTLSAAGTVSFDDVEQDERVSVRYTPNSDVVWSGGSVDPVLAAQLLGGLNTGVTTSIVPSSTAWQYNVANANLDFLAAGETITFSYTITARDSAGNTGFASAPLNFTVVNSTGLVTPVVTASVSRTLTPVVRGTALLRSGDSLSVSVNGASYDGVVVDTQGRWFIDTGTAVSTSGTLAAFLDGQAYDVIATVSNASASVTDASASELRIDTQAPQTPTVDSVISHSLRPVLTGLTTLADGDVLTVTLGTASWTVVPAPDGRWTVDTAQHVPTSGNLPVLQDGQTYNVTATIVDVSGRSVSDTSTAELIINTALADTMAPAAPRVSTVSAGGTPLVSNGFTSDTLPTFTVQAEPGSTLRVFNGDTFLGTAVESTASPGSFSFTPDTALATGRHSITFRATDALGAKAQQTLGFTLTGTNDAPVVTSQLSAAQGAVTEAGHQDDGTVVAGTATATGTLTASDVDNGATRSWSILSGGPTTYGSIGIDAATGIWSYTLDNTLAATQALREGETATQTYTARVTDDQGAFADQIITITIKGSNDVPVLTLVTNTDAETRGSVTEAGHQDDGTATPGISTATGTLSVSDVDNGATRSWSILPGGPTAYGSIGIDAATGVWTYMLDNTLAATQALREGETVTQTYTARATDDFGAYADQTLTITILGTNDGPVVSNEPGHAQGSVTEAGHQDDGAATPGISTATGALSVSDVDNGATRSWSILPGGPTTYGSIGIDAATGVWTYTLDNSLQATRILREGQSITQTYTARAIDDFGAYVDQTVTVTINGSNDVPTVAGPALEDAAYLQGQRFEQETVRLFSDIDADAGPFTYSAQLPPGLAIDAQTGLIYGAGIRPGDYVVVIRATDAQGAWTETTWNLRINAPAQTGSTGNNSSSSSTGSGASGSPALPSPSPSPGGQNTGNASAPISVLNGSVAGLTSNIPVPAGTDPAAGMLSGTGTAAALSSPAVGQGNAISPATATGTGPTALDAGPTASANSTSQIGTGLATGSADAAQGSGSPTDGSPSGTGSADSARDSQPASDQAARTDARVGADGQLQLGQKAPADSAGGQENTRRTAERIDVTVGANGQISLRQEAAQGDASSSGILLVEVAQKDKALQIEIADFRKAQAVQYRASLPDGSPLPAWIRIDPATGRITAEPDSRTQLIELVFTAQDADGSTRTLEIKIDLSQLSQRTGLSSGSESVALGRPAFMTQLAAQQQHWDGYGQQLLSAFTEY